MRWFHTASSTPIFLNDTVPKNMRGEFMKKQISFFLLVIVFAILSACGGTDNEDRATGEVQEEKQGDTIKLTYAFFAPANTFPAVQMEEWKKRLEERTDGKVEVELFFGGSLLEANNMFDGVENGTADIGLTSTTYEPGRFPLLAISDMPSGYKNATSASKVVADLIEEYPPASLESFKIITVFTTEPAYIQSNEPIATLEDLSGQQLRIAGALTPIMEKLGAAPVGMSQAEVPEALQTGIIDGYVSSREILQDSRLAEMVGYTTNYPLALNTFVAVMHKDTWEALPEDVQQVIDELKDEMTEFTGNYLDKHVQESIQWSKENYNHEIVELSASEKEKWDSILQKVQEEYVKELEQEGLPAEEYYRKMKDLIEKYNAEEEQ